MGATVKAKITKRLVDGLEKGAEVWDTEDMLDGVVERGSPFMANRLLAHVRALCNWCVPRGLVTVPPPTYMVKAPTKERARERVLTSAEIRAMWKACDFIGYPMGWVIQFMLVTGQREGECAGIHAGELDGEVWKLPPERTKNGNEHWVPLPPMGREILARVPAGVSPSGLFFTGTGTTPVSGWSKAKSRIDEVMAKGGHTVHWVLHDLRRTVQTNIARLGFTDDVGDAVTNHVKKGMAGVYNRHRYMKEKREALEAWEGRLRAILAGEDFKEEGEA